MPPIDPTLPLDPRTLAAAMDYREAMKDSRDMAADMLRTFKGLSDILSATTRMTGDSAVNFTKMAEMSKQVLRNTKARGQIDQQIYSEIERSEEKITQLQFKKIKYEEDRVKLTREAGESLLEYKKKEAKMVEEQLVQNSKIAAAQSARAVAEHSATVARATSDVIGVALAASALALAIEQEQLAKKTLQTAQNEMDVAKKISELKEKERVEGRAYYDEQIKKEKEIVEQNKKASREYKSQAGFMAHIAQEEYKSIGPLGDMVSKAKNFRDTIEKIPIRFLALSAIIKEGVDLFVKLDKAAENFRKETGFSVNQMRDLRSDVEAVNREYQYMGVGIEEAYKSAKALTDVFGRTSLVTKEALGNVALLSANLGVAEADSANVLANFQGLGKATQEAAMNVIKVGAGISEKAGIPFKLVMNDIANASEQTTAMLGANPSKLMKSAIAARALGTDMNKIVSSQRKLLDYNTSINSELEASALLGRSISFQKARQLAYDGDIAGAAKATLDTVKKAGDFEKMSLYQREKLAEAAGMELKDLTKMMAVEKQRDAILLGGDQAAKDKLLAQEETLRNLEKENDLTKQSLVDANERAIKQQQIQGTVTKFKNLWDSIILQLGSVLEPIIRDIAETLIPIAVTTLPMIANIAKIIGMAFKLVYSVVSGLLSPFEGIFASLEDILGGSEGFSSYLVEVGKALDEYVVPIFKNLGGVIGSIGMLILKFVLAPITMIGDVIGRVVGIAVGLISGDLNIGDAIVETLKIIPSALWSTIVSPMIDVGASILKLFGLDIPKGIIEGLKDLPGVLLDLLQSGFQAAWRWINKHWLGHSPSEIGIGIVEGIKSVGGMLLDALTWPFRTAFNFISDIFSGDGDIIDTIIGGIKMAASFVFDILTLPFRTVVNFVSGLFGGDGNLGTSIIDGIKSITGVIFDVLASPFKLGFEFVTSAFSFVVEGIKNAASEIFGFITSPFKKALEFVKNIPFIGKLFGENDIATESKPQIDNTAMETTSVIEVKNLDALREVVQQLTDAVANLSNSDKTETETLAVGTKVDTSALEAKLDTLTNLLVGGAVRVYLDGKDVSAAMSATGR